jgi:hypothetical protein
MKGKWIAALVLAALLVQVRTGEAQAPRKDYVWARSTNGAPITMDGILNEPAWAAADSVVIRFAQDAGIPGSGYFFESGVAPSDPTWASLKFVTVGNQLWMGAFIHDKSIGGQKTFNRFDGLLIGIKDHSNPNRPVPPLEYFYSWWYPEDSLAAIAPGAPPRFRGRWTGCWDTPTPDCTRPRTAEEIANWDAVTVVNGTSNTDASNDGGYVVEMRFNLDPIGYDVTAPGGDAVEFNVSVYDADWNWPFQNFFSANRVWWEGPWGRDAFFHNGKILARPGVTVSSGAAPAYPPDIRIPAADNYAAPTMDGLLNEPVWTLAPGLDIRYGDDGLRASYPGMGPWRSGQYQPTVNAGQAAVVDPGDATVKWFFKGDKLYLGFDVRDQVVQSVANADRYDGFTISLNDYTARGIENHQLVGYKLTFQVGPSGNALAQDELPPYITNSGALVALALKPGTTLDTLGQTPDVGYTAEMWLDLTKFGYPVGRGDGRVFLGIDLLDGDSFTPFTDSYGTRTWWQREYAGGSGAGGGGPDGPAWGYLDPGIQVTGVFDPVRPGGSLALLGNEPNPYHGKTSVRLSLSRAGRVTLEVYDLQGRLVASRAYGRMLSGPANVTFAAEGLKSGLYLYRVRLKDDAGREESTQAGRMLLTR